MCFGIPMLSIYELWTFYVHFTYSCMAMLQQELVEVQINLKRRCDNGEWASKDSVKKLITSPKPLLKLVQIQQLSKSPSPQSYTHPLPARNPSPKNQTRSLSKNRYKKNPTKLKSQQRPGQYHPTKKTYTPETWTSKPRLSRYSPMLSWSCRLKAQLHAPECIRAPRKIFKG